MGFCRIPSQFLENFCYEPEFLKLLRNIIKQEKFFLMKKLKKSSSQKFMEGYQTLRQLGFGLLDMNYHTKVGELENKV
jgi:peptidyl-dipeptidase Dcp